MKFKKVLKKYWWISLIIIFLATFIYGGFNGWYKNIFMNSVVPSGDTYYCCNSGCNLGVCAPNTFVYLGGFDSLDSCNSKCLIGLQQPSNVQNNVIPVAYTCTDSDGGQDDQQFVRGTVTTNFNNVPLSFTDECNWGNGHLTEYYCDTDKSVKMYDFACENYWECLEGKCSQPICEDIMNPTPDKCLAGKTSDGGTCQYWNFNGNELCLSSFN